MPNLATRTTVRNLVIRGNPELLNSTKEDNFLNHVVSRRTCSTRRILSFERMDDEVSVRASREDCGQRLRTWHAPISVVGFQEDQALDRLGTPSCYSCAGMRWLAGMSIFSSSVASTMRSNCTLQQRTSEPISSGYLYLQLAAMYGRHLFRRRHESTD
jgi:hypothetical protein